MDLSASDNPPRSNQQRQHQYVNDWHKPTPSSRQTTAIDLSRPLAPVYHCNVPVISQTQGPVIVTADHAPPPPTWHANDSCWQLQSQPSNIRPPIYEISSSDDDTVASDASSRLVIDENVDSSATRNISNEYEIDANQKKALFYSAKESINPPKTKNKDGLKLKKSEGAHVLHSMKLKNFALPTIKLGSKKNHQKPDLFKSKDDSSDDKKSTANEIMDAAKYNVKVNEHVSPLKLIFTKSSKGNKNPATPHAESKAVMQDGAGSSEGLKSSTAAENRAKLGTVKSHSSKDYKYEKNTEQYGKQTTCKSSSNNTKSHKDRKSHDSTKKPPREDSKVEMKKHLKVHASAVMSAAANPKTKPCDEHADNKKAILTDAQLLRKFGCTKKPKVVLHRLSKEEIKRFTRHRSKNVKIGTTMKPAKAVASSKIDKSLRAAALMDLLNPVGSSARTATPRPKIIFAPRRVVKCHNTAATAAPVEKQKHRGSSREEKKKICVRTKTYPREVIGLLERDIERAVPLERFINDEKRSAKVDWMVLDGKMQYSMHHRECLRNTVKVKILMPPHYYATDLQSQIEEQQQKRAEAIAEIKLHHRPQFLSEKSKLNQKLLTDTFRFMKIGACCTTEEKVQCQKKIENAAHRPFTNLFPTPRASIEKQQDLLPNHWRSKILSEPFLIGKYLLRGVNPLSGEFSYVQAKFNKSSRERVLAIDKVENPHLWLRYQLQKERLKLKAPFVQELHLFHGTNKKYLDPILTYNLDWKFFGRKKGSRFGRGMYFSPLSSYALHYTDHAKEHSIMILFRVLTVKQCIGYEDSELPDEGYDTAISENGKVWVKYDADEMYPDYVIHFNYEDPEDKALLYEKYRNKLEKKQAAKWKKRFEALTVWNEFRQKHQTRPMTWRRFYRKVKRWKLKPLRKKKGVTMKNVEWSGPNDHKKRSKNVTRDKLNTAPYKAMSLWKQPKNAKFQAKKPFANYRAKKRQPWNKNINLA